MNLGELNDKLLQAEEMDGDGELPDEKAPFRSKNEDAVVVVMDGQTGAEFELAQVTVAVTEDDKMKVTLITGQQVG